MIKNSHTLVHAKDAGGGYHGRCDLALVTDLGYNSWADVKCIDREITKYQDIPIDIIKYSKFRGLIWNNILKKFVKPYTDTKYTIDELNNILTESITVQL